MYKLRPYLPVSPHNYYFSNLDFQPDFMCALFTVEISKKDLKDEKLKISLKLFQ